MVTKRWILGGVIACGMAGAAPVVAADPAPFDAPVTADTVPLPKDELNPDAAPGITCSRYPAFAVKQVDIGEVGAQKLALIDKDGACTVDTAGERLITDDLAGYFLGVSGNYVFFQGSDGWNGGMPFVVYDRRTAARLFDDSFAGERIDAIEATDGRLTLRFRRSLTTACSLYKDKGDCAAKIAAETGFALARIPTCDTAYEDEKTRTPDFAADIEKLPSVVDYPVELTFTAGKVTITPLDGPVSCHLPS